MAVGLTAQLDMYMQHGTLEKILIMTEMTGDGQE